MSKTAPAGLCIYAEDGTPIADQEMVSAMIVTGTAAIRLVLTERASQISEHGHTKQDDMQCRDGELLQAALAYMAPHGLAFWPWETASFKKSTQAQRDIDPLKCRIKDLTKGLALGLAELERLISLQPQESGNE